MGYIENRYAIIIGINDYERSPLNFCVNDADEIKNTLVRKCRFKEENVIKITSDDINSEKDITGRYLEAIRYIRNKFIKGRDSILFYFAGHGACDNSKSVLWFQKSSYPIEEVFANISTLEPKIQTYIIDACQSGSKVLTRGEDDNLEKYLKSVEGAMFLYACRNTEYAGELSELKHGLLTYKVIEATSKKELYDGDGYLSFNRIVDFVQKETSKASGFKQVPVIENNVAGFYPFAFSSEKLENIKEEISLNKGIKRNEHDLKDIRISLKLKCKEACDKEFDKMDFNEYEEIKIHDLKDLEDIDTNDLKEGIVTYVEDEKLVPLKKLIYSREKEKNHNPLFGGVMQTIALLQNQTIKTKEYIIDFDSKNIESEFRIYKSDNINKVSFSVGYIIYQAKWGIVLLKIAFLLDWDGEKDCEISDITIEDIGISLEEDALELVGDITFGFEEYINELISKWNQVRKDELDRYRKYKEIKE